MKVSLKRKIDFTAIDSDFVLTLHSLVKILQEAAIEHSNRAGFGSKQLINDGSVWILYQYGIEVGKWADYEDEIEVVTWHRGMKGFKAYREFEVYSGDQKIASASAVYLYYDIKNRKIRRIPEEANSIYSAEDEVSFKDDLEQWKPIPKFDHKFDLSITTRLSDFDPMGHVNNSVYFDYVETMLFSYLGEEKKIKKIKIQFAKEINKSVKKLKSGLTRDGAGFKFKIFDENKVFSVGEIEI
jgi:medium-chain acyl-[acyl-carrier-protein] hydrolase